MHAELFCEMFKFLFPWKIQDGHHHRKQFNKGHYWKSSNKCLKIQKRTDNTLTERKRTNIKSMVHKTLQRYKKIHKPTGKREGGPQMSQYGKQCRFHWFIRRVTRVKNALIRHDRGTRDGVMTTTTRTYM